MKARYRLLTLIAAVVSLSVPAGAAPAPSPRGGEIPVSTDKQGYHSNPSVAAFRDGSFVVAWTVDGIRARARFFDRQGRPASGEIPLGMGGGLVGTVDQVVADGNGSFLLVMTGYPIANAENVNVYVRRFSRRGRPLGKVIRANAPSSQPRSRGVAAIGPDGRFVVAWQAVVSSPGTTVTQYTNAVARFFSPQGTPLTEEITLHEGYSGSFAGDDWIDALPNSVAIAPDGTLSAVIQEDGAVDHAYSLVRLPAGGEPSLRGLSGCGVPYETRASLAMGADGSLVAAWSCYDILALRLSPSGTPRGGNFLVGEELSEYQLDPSVALQAGGSFVIVWADQQGLDGEETGVFGRAFAPNGTPRTGDFPVNLTTEGFQQEPAIAAARRGNVLVVWSQRLTEHGRSDIFARVLSADQ